MQTAKDPLLQPFQLSHLTLKDRIMSTRHTMLSAVDGAPQQRYQRYHEEKGFMSPVRTGREYILETVILARARSSPVREADSRRAKDESRGKGTDEFRSN